MRQSEIKVFHNDDGSLTLQMRCCFCGHDNALKLPAEKLKMLNEGLPKWMNGALLQNAFPDFTPDERDFFITGNCKCIWG